ncbi:uncharacterized protein LOC120268943 [Dioscorea cayenensis subsp. rotundata]|uniref:Uncharacterized protein LOC120268943 n=1 Tax=Dioscorea cayennensis subsp. rotundata TaxID=55577 RepID=A0AB40BXF7_DIOCR|nr:uncharacterized protein LOC120268943 [Dioscorea cayenensis subsp. rotundata]
MLFESLNLQELQLNVNWEDVVCPVCLEFPHNAVLLHCSSYDKGCRPFMCDTDHSHSNCLDRFKTTHGLPTAFEPSSSPSDSLEEIVQLNPTTVGSFPICPLCRGEVKGWVVVNEARVYLNMKERCCQEKECSFVGNYMELQVHTKQNHPNARPSEIDPARKLEWENFQQSTELIDVLSTIHSEVPHGLVLGDYVVEYLNDSGDDYDDFGDDGNWWTSCIFYHMFENFRVCGNRQRRSRTSDNRNHHIQRSRYDASITDEGSTSSVEVVESRFDEIDGDEEVVVGSSGGSAVSGGSANHRSYRRRRSQM